ncbi:MAG: ferredoxin [SAR324 cluster bacterium]|nr:ferredoxin [SAR324 cluster bacterium]
MEQKITTLIEEVWRTRVESLFIQVPKTLEQLESMLINGAGDQNAMRKEVLSTYNMLKDLLKLFEDKGSILKGLENEIEATFGELKKKAVAQAIQNLVVQLTGGSAEGLDLSAFQMPASAPAGSAPSSSSAENAASAPAAGGGDVAWIESNLCTACDECTTINKGIFAYNAEKKAFVKNPKGGPFRDIVKAAEKCPSQIIHPGDPQDPKEKDVAKWVERAKKFQ